MKGLVFFWVFLTGLAYIIGLDVVVNNGSLSEAIISGSLFISSSIYFFCLLKLRD